MRNKILHHSHWIFFQWFTLLISLLTIGGIICYSLTLQYRLIEVNEQARLSNLANVLDINLEHLLDATNQAMERIRDDLFYWKSKQNGESLINWRLRSMSDDMIGVRTIQILNASGVTTASNRDELIGRDFAAREYFKTPSQHPDPALLFVSPPFNTILGVYAMNLTRVLTGPEGEFDGIITATLEPEYFASLLESVLMAPDARASVNHRDGKVLLSVPDRKDVEGMDLSKPGTFHARHLESKQTDSLFTGQVYAIGDERMIAIRTVTSAKFIADKSLEVAVSRDLNTIFTDWHHEAFLTGALFGLLSLASVFSFYIYQRREQKFIIIESC
jgi:hypothetical protein